MGKLFQLQYKVISDIEILLKYNKNLEAGITKKDHSISGISASSLWGLRVTPKMQSSYKLKDNDKGEKEFRG
jgi:hypothetical protein